MAASTEGEYGVEYRLEPIKYWKADEDTGKMVGSKGDNMALNILKHHTDGSHIATVRVCGVAVATFRLEEGMEFTVLKRTNKQNQSFRTVRFLARIAESKQDKPLVFELKARDSAYDALFGELKKTGAVVKGLE